MWIESELGICTCCNAQKELYYRDTIEFTTFNGICKQCYDYLSREINCIICGKGMKDLEYTRHLAKH